MHRYSDPQRSRKPSARFCPKCGKYNRNYKSPTRGKSFPPASAPRCNCDGKWIPGTPRYCKVCGGRMNQHKVACGDDVEFQVQDFEEFQDDMNQMPDKDDPVWKK